MVDHLFYRRYYVGRKAWHYKKHRAVVDRTGYTTALGHKWYWSIEEREVNILFRIRDEVNPEASFEDVDPAKVRDPVTCEVSIAALHLGSERLGAESYKYCQTQVAHQQSLLGCPAMHSLEQKKRQTASTSHFWSVPLAKALLQATT